MIHFIQSAPRGVVELPYLLKGEAPPARTDEADDESNIGSKNYSQAPKAVILGGGLTDNHIAQMREACKDVPGIAWIRPDLAKPTPPVGTREYGLALVERSKAMLKNLKEIGEMGKDGVYWY